MSYSVRRKPTEMNRRQLLALGMVPTVSIVAGCVDSESTVEPESSERNSTDDQESDNQEDDDHTDNGSATGTDDRCMDDAHAVIVDDSDVPDEATVVDLSQPETMYFDHDGTVAKVVLEANDQ